MEKNEVAVIYTLPQGKNENRAINYTQYSVHATAIRMLPYLISCAILIRWKCCLILLKTSVTMKLTWSMAFRRSCRRRSDSQISFLG